MKQTVCVNAKCAYVSSEREIVIDSLCHAVCSVTVSVNLLNGEEKNDRIFNSSACTYNTCCSHKPIEELINREWLTG